MVQQLKLNSMKRLYKSLSSWNRTVLVLLCVGFIATFFIEGVWLLSFYFTKSKVTEYYFFKVFLPSVLGYLILTIIGYIVCFKLKKEAHKDLATLITITSVAALLGFINYIYPQITLILVIPVFLSSVFENRKVQRGIFISSIMATLATCGLAVLMIERKYKDIAIEYALDALIIYISYLSSALVVKRYSLTITELSKSHKEIIELNKFLKEDSLTGLLNHQAIKTYLELYTHKSTTRSIHFAMIDFDNFKNINDTYGHVEGDNVIICFSNLVKKLENDNIIGGRYGGEEFTISFINMETADVSQVLNKLLKEFTNENKYHISFSCGVNYQKDDFNAQNIILNADKLLYKVKADGKSSVLFDSKAM